jgi:hypothetical protein
MIGPPAERKENEIQTSSWESSPPQWPCWELGVSKASSITFDSIGDAALFSYALSVDGANLCADVNYILSSWSGNTATFHVSAHNCSSGAGSGVNPNRLTSFGVGVINPDLLFATVPGVSEWDATTNTNFAGFGTVGLCSYAGVACSAGASLGVFVGVTDQFDLTLAFASAVGSFNPITFTDPFPSTWQEVGASGRSIQFGGCLLGTPMHRYARA